MLELINVCRDFPVPGVNEPAHILKNINLRVEAGQSVSIVGPSGSGKSTLLNIISGLDEPSAGAVIVNGSDLKQMNEKALAKLRNQDIGFVFQLHHLLPQCSVLENVIVPTLAGFCEESKNQIEQRALELIEAVGLADHKNHRPGELSVGQRQRTALARALVNEPKLLLADEPTGALDADTAGEISELLIELNEKRKVTLVVVTHSMDLAKKMSKVYKLDNGSLSEES